MRYFSEELPHLRQMSEAERLRYMFLLEAELFSERAAQNLELARALGDEKAVLVEQVKLSVMQKAVELLEIACYDAKDERWDKERKRPEWLEPNR